MNRIRIEFTTEPFVIGKVPDHATAVAKLAENLGLETEFGPFGTTVIGSKELVLGSLEKIMQTAFDNGAIRISVQATTSASIPRKPGLHDALERLLLQVEVELGAQLEDLSREEKQRAVRLLDDRGAFHLRGSIEDVADRLGVSRFTVYNYLNATKE